MRNAYFGYTYQQLVTKLFIVLMDVKREIDSIEIEGIVDNKFDDQIITVGQDQYYFQIKNYIDISLDDLIFSKKNVLIKKVKHKFSTKKNVLVFSDIKIEYNTKLFGIPCLEKDGVYIVSINRESLEKAINSLYENQGHRRFIIESFISEILDERKLIIDRSDLPTIDVFRTNLLEETINVGIKQIETSKLFFIEGKPGVGKSHLVNLLKEKFQNHIIYRFWISNQDTDYKLRLKFDNFINDLSKQLCNDFKKRTVEEVVSLIELKDKVLLLDGLDHIENYNLNEFEKYIKFINKLSRSGKIIVFSRPLHNKIECEKFILRNWNRAQTEKVLDELYHISDHDVKKQIFDVTNGYPILVRYISEYYRAHNLVPNLEQFKSINDYYDEIFKNQKGKRALSLFLYFHCFLMKSEIYLFLDFDLADIVNDFIKEHPYLFEHRLNRVTLFHDSLVTYLRNLNIDSINISKKININVYESIMNGESRFLSRFGNFNLSIDQKKKIIRKYSCVEEFAKLASEFIDVESLKSFYFQIQVELSKLHYNDLEITQYYALSLILNIVSRDHVSGNQEFYFNFSKALKINGYSEENITSSGYLFAMYSYLDKKDLTLWYNLLSDNNFSIEFFHKEWENVIENQENFFVKYSSGKKEERIVEIFMDENYHFRDRIIFCLVNIYVNKLENGKLNGFYQAINLYINGNHDKAASIICKEINRRDLDYNIALYILEESLKLILALGLLNDQNELKNYTLGDLIINNTRNGSFDMLRKTIDYLRLSVEEKRKIDISSIGVFWMKYHQRRDYSMLSLPRALNILEKSSIIELVECVNLIIEFQIISEKGYRELLTDFIILYPSNEIFDILAKYFNLIELRIEWFQLPIEYINVLDRSVINYAFDVLIKENWGTKEIDFSDLYNLFDSKWEYLIKERLDNYTFSIRIHSKHHKYKELIEKRYNIVENNTYEGNNESTYKESLERYHKGILNINDKEFIIKTLKTPQELAGFTNGYYSTLDDLQLYELFDPIEIKKNFSQIFYNSILGKVNDNCFYPSVNYFPGNILYMVDKYNIDVKKEDLFKSFLKYFELSSFKLI